MKKTLTVTGALVALALVTQLMVATFARAADWQSAGCKKPWLCLYADKNWNEASKKLSELDTENESKKNNVVNFGGGNSFNDKMTSWISQRTHYSRWYFDADAKGPSRCIRPMWTVSEVERSENDKASSAALYVDNTSC